MISLKQMFAQNRSHLQTSLDYLTNGPNDLLFYNPKVLRILNVVTYIIFLAASTNYLMTEHPNPSVALAGVALIAVQTLLSIVQFIYAHRYYKACILVATFVTIVDGVAFSSFRDGFWLNPHLVFILWFLLLAGFTTGRSGMIATALWIVTVYTAFKVLDTWGWWPLPVAVTIESVRHENFSATFLILAVSVPLLWAYLTLVRDSLQRLRLLYIQQRQHDQHLLQTLTAERARIGRDLHDGPLKENTLTKYKLEVCAALLDKGDMAGAQVALEQGLDLLATQHTRIRAVVDAVRPQELTVLGLAAALRALPTQLGLPMAVTIHCDEQITYDAAGDAAIYYIVREALVNAHQHGQAQHATVQVAVAGVSLTLDINDDGQGFDPQASPQSVQGTSHHGLSSMADRAVLLGGQLQIQSVPGQGTHIHVVLPLTQSDLEKVA